MARTDFDPQATQAENRKVDVKAEAQRSKMAEATASKPEFREGSKEPNAGGGNREKGDRKGR